MRLFILVAGFLCLFLSSPLPAYEVVLKTGTILKGTLVREDSESVVLKDASGIEITIKKTRVDAEKTTKANKPAASADKAPDPKKKGRVYTQEDLESLREKYDLGTKSYGGEYSPLVFPKEKETKAKPASDANFKTAVLESDIPVLVDFWAPWCGPCRQVSPRVEAVGVEFADRAKIYKVNVDDNPDLARTYGISAIPTLMFFKDGEIAATIVGAAEQAAIASKLEEVLK